MVRWLPPALTRRAAAVGEAPTRQLCTQSCCTVTTHCMCLRLTNGTRPNRGGHGNSAFHLSICGAQMSGGRPTLVAWGNWGLVVDHGNHAPGVARDNLQSSPRISVSSWKR